MTTSRVETPHVPGWVDGGLFPTGDETRLRGLATAWSTQGTQSDEQADELDLTFRAGARSYVGDAADAATGHVGQVRGFLSSTGSGCTALGSACTDAATTIEYAKTATNVALLELETRSQQLAAQPADDPVGAVTRTLQLRQMQIATALQIRAIHETAKASMAAITVEVDIQPALTVPTDTRSPYVPNTPGTLFNRERVEQVADTGQLPMPGEAGSGEWAAPVVGDGEQVPPTDLGAEGDGTGEGGDTDSGELSTEATPAEDADGNPLTDLFDPRTLVGGSTADDDASSLTEAEPVDDTGTGTVTESTESNTEAEAGSAGETGATSETETGIGANPESGAATTVEAADPDTGRFAEPTDHTPVAPLPTHPEPPSPPAPPAQPNPTPPGQSTWQPAPSDPAPSGPTPSDRAPGSGGSGQGHHSPGPSGPSERPAPVRGPDPTWTPPSEVAPAEVTNPGTGAAGTAPIVDRPTGPLPHNPTGGLGGPSPHLGGNPSPMPGGGSPVGGPPGGGSPVGGPPVGGPPVGAPVSGGGSFGGGQLGSGGGANPVPAQPSQPVGLPNPAQPPAPQPQPPAQPQPQPPAQPQPNQPQPPNQSQPNQSQPNQSQPQPSQSRPGPIPADPLRPAPEPNEPAPLPADTTPTAGMTAAATAVPVAMLGLAPLLADLRRTPSATPRPQGSLLPTQFGPGDEPLAALPVTVQSIYQKVLLPGEAEAMLAGQVTTLRGLLHLHDQIGDVTAPRQLHDLLGLGFAVRDGRGQLQRAFDPAMSSVDVLRCAGIRGCDLVVPVAPDVAANDGAVVSPGSAIAPMIRQHARPWTGSGLAPGSTEDRVIEEFELLAEVGLPIPHLAEIWRFHDDGSAEHLGTHNARIGAWQGIPATSPVHGEPVTLGPQAVLADGSRWSTVVLNDREVVLVDRSGALAPGFTEAADRSGRRVVALPEIASFLRTATTALWHGARVLVLARSGAHVLIDFVDEAPDAATGLGFVQLGQGQWQQRWVPGTELTAWQTWERTYPQDPPVPAGTG